MFVLTQAWRYDHDGDLTMATVSEGFSGVNAQIMARPDGNIDSLRIQPYLIAMGVEMRNCKPPNRRHWGW